MSAFQPARAGGKTTTRARAIGYAVVYVGAGTMLLLLIVTLAQLRQLAGENARGINLIEDCTTAGGDCYERSRANTGDVISVLNDFTIYVVACADREGIQSVARIRACAIKEARKATP